MSSLPLFTEMEAEARRSGQLSGWLQKKKSGNSVMRVRQYNRRYFTLDFDHRVFFYAHEPSSRKVSVPIPFDTIMDVNMSPDPSSCTSSLPPASNGGSQRKLSTGSLSRRFSLSRDNLGNQQQPCITVRANGRFMELLCASTAEAIQWFQALKGAMLFDANGDRIKRTEDSRENATTTADGSEGNERMEAEQREDDEQPPTPPNDNSPREKKQGLEVRQHDAERDLGAGDTALANDGEAARPQAPRSMFDFDNLDTDQREVEKPAEVETVQETGHLIQAEDFGFEACEDDSDSDSGGSQASERMCMLPIKTNEGCQQTQEGGAASSSSSPVNDSKPPASSHANGAANDRHVGMSLQERMAALQFSDDEDEEFDEDDPLGLGAQRDTGSPAQRSPAQRATGSTAQSSKPGGSSHASPAISPVRDKEGAMSAFGNTARSAGCAYPEPQAFGSGPGSAGGGYAQSYQPVPQAACAPDPVAASSQSPSPQKPTKASTQLTPGASSSSASPSPSKLYAVEAIAGGGLAEGRSDLVNEEVFESPVHSPGAARSAATPLGSQGLSPEVVGGESVEKKKKKKKKEDKDADPEKPDKEKKKKKKSSISKNLTGEDGESPEKEKKKKKKASKTENDTPRRSKELMPSSGANPLTPTQIQNISPDLAYQA